MAKVFDPSVPATLEELSQYYAKKQPHQVDQLTEETPILKRLKFEEASHGLWNTYEEITGVKGAGLVEMNSPLGKVDVATELKRVELNIFGGEIECPQDTAKMYGGRDKYFARRMPVILRESGMGAEKTLLYKNMRQYALDNKGLAINAGATVNGCYSIIALRQVPGETIGLYSPEGFKQGAMFETGAINGGNLYHNPARVLVYGMFLKAYLGYQIANKNSVSAIVNITKDNIPTEAMIDDVLANAHATPASTLLLMHPRCLNLLNKYKGDKLRLSNSDDGINRMFENWNKIEIVTTYNFMKGTEEKVTVK